MSAAGVSAEKAKIIYPAYFDKAKTVAQGRRIPLENCVSDPKPNEVVDALAALKGFSGQIEPKAYCREPNKELLGWRVRYVNVKSSLQTKRQILTACAKRINEVRAKSQHGSNQAEGSGSGKQKKKNKQAK